MLNLKKRSQSMKNIAKWIAPILTLGVLVGCGSSVSTDTNTTNTVDPSLSTIPGETTLTDTTTDEVEGYVGVLVDAPVIGASFNCGGVSGLTDVNGTFGICPMGSSVTFAVGNVVLGTVAPTPDYIFTPQDIVGVPRTEVNNENVTLMASLLLSLDRDGDPENGIEITTEVVTALNEEVPDITPIEELNNEEVVEVVTAVDEEVEEVDLAVVEPEETVEHLTTMVEAIDSGEIPAPVQPVVTEVVTDTVIDEGTDVAEEVEDTADELTETVEDDVETTTDDTVVPVVPTPTYYPPVYDNATD